MNKSCPNCGDIKDTGEFYVLPNGHPDSWCKFCRCQYQKRYTAGRRGYGKKYRAANPTKLSEWRKANTEHLREYERARYHKNKTPFLERARKRKLIVRGIKGGHTTAQWLDLLFIYQHKCYGCGRSDLELTKDHIIAVSRGGSDCIENIAPLCRSCNSKKNSKGPGWYLTFWVAQRTERVQAEQQ